VLLYTLAVASTKQALPLGALLASFALLRCTSFEADSPGAPELSDATDTADGGFQGPCDRDTKDGRNCSQASDKEAVFVDGDIGRDGNLGTRLAPVATLEKALRLANGRRIHLCASAKEYEGVLVAKDAKIYGGFACKDFTYTAAKAAITAKRGGFALDIQAGEVFLADLELKGAPGLPGTPPLLGVDAGAPDAGVDAGAEAGAEAGAAGPAQEVLYNHSIAIRVLNSKNVELQRVRALADKAVAGVNAPLTQASMPASAPANPILAAHSLPIANVCPDGSMSVGGAGGEPGKSGLPGVPDAPGAFGDGGVYAASGGQAGVDGAPGVDGAQASASTLGVFVGGMWLGSKGTLGRPGTTGTGGGGGAARYVGTTGFRKGNAGSAGGCGGRGGLGGQAGGSSVALLAINSGVRLTQVELVTDVAGAGGAGAKGEPGQAPGAHNSVAPGGAGGTGGRGGNGAAGSAGAGGLSVGILWDKFKPTLDATAAFDGSKAKPGEGSPAAPAPTLVYP
jgi:hypothetical protein